MKTLKITLIALMTIAISAIYAQSGVLKNQPTKPAKPQVKVIADADYKAHADGWMVDMDKAYALSKKTGKPIMANFTGSDWCGWCKKLKYEVFDKAAFKTWAKKNVILVELDFPRRFQIPKKYQEQNYKLARGFAVTGYPTIWVFDMDKDDKGQYSITKLGKTGYVSGVSNFTVGVDKMIKKGKK